MMPTHVPEQFDRIMGCTAAELISWLPRSLPDGQLARGLAAFAVVTLARSLLRIPQLQVHFAFQGLDDAARYSRQIFFDLHTHRGGG